jgi:peptidoglycan hydrolase CwlO-like protein
MPLFVCLVVLWSGALGFPHVAEAQTLSAEERVVLQAQYDQLLKEIAVQEQIIKDTQAEKNTLQGDVTSLTAKINAAQAQINAKNITIKQLGSEITKKNAVIGELSGRIARGQESLAGLLRQTQMLNDASFVLVALGSKSVSEFFTDLDSFTSIKTDLRDLFAEIRSAKAQTEKEKADLAVKQDQTADAKYAVEVQQKKIAADKVETQKLLAIKTNEEKEYQKVLLQRQTKAAELRATLFPLRDAGPITFGTALAYAKNAHAKTGVRSAFILAILTQESNLGANVGQCYLTNDSTGAGVGKNSGKAFAKVMSPTRDVPIFLKLGFDLGFDPHKQVVSCPIASAGGWGGAMGPAQFIPSTWGLYAARVAKANGVSVANPWDARDAITAMAAFLADLNADAGGYSAEHKAAARYYAGSAWATAGKSYANSVMALATKIQGDIDFLSDN